MILKDNITIDPLMGELIKQNALSIVDKIKLKLANFVAELYPKCEVYINANQQDTQTPCFFIDIYEINKRKKLGNLSQYEIGFVISYVPLDTLSSTELNNVIFKVGQHITDIDYPIHSVNNDITDKTANITGVIIVNENTIIQDPLIKKADKELIV